MGHQPEFDIPALLDEHGPASGPELAQLLDAHPSTVERRCRTLQRDGQIRLVTGGQYAIVEQDTVRTRSASD
ncbi:HTH domain-containing protein [Salinibaculum rarum]|uniref:HTH domain-containing protein n=1 Tax=Salinibaculum rarum TaxID=3058903 RepID=UPI00265EBFD0|nr:HTH domain-containing protein [Salinibaculum sp. KK48]